MNCNLTDEERKTKKARCRSWDCSACNNFYSNCLNEEINKLDKENKELKSKLETAIKALELYALKSNYTVCDEGRNYSVSCQCYELDEQTYGDMELGTRARQALKDIKGE